ncbi:hypothetical protein CPB84DRAFT_1828524 [Gymnopilus junonius]|uniref:Uncharacterized protein n=1 Tax=Gymnopilus junonius TaxID=109634 RepID=A0A9P5TGR6_GYMJU|nr:hypothetical protein CPB84DRAFT_1828524 [Gymnopilus junonius]
MEYQSSAFIEKVYVHADGRKYSVKVLPPKGYTPPSPYPQNVPPTPSSYAQYPSYPSSPQYPQVRNVMPPPAEEHRSHRSHRPRRGSSKAWSLLDGFPPMTPTPTSAGRYRNPESPRKLRRSRTSHQHYSQPNIVYVPVGWDVQPSAVQPVIQQPSKKPRSKPRSKSVPGMKSNQKENASWYRPKRPENENALIVDVSVPLAMGRRKQVERDDFTRHDRTGGSSGHRYATDAHAYEKGPVGTMKDWLTRNWLSRLLNDL